MLVNLAYLLRQPTGTTTYALNLLPYLAALNPFYLATQASGLQDYYPVPENMTAEHGLRGHLKRLLWTQFRLPEIYRQLTKHSPSQDLLFSPISEAPLWSKCRSVVMIHDLIPLRFPVSRAQTWLHRYYIPRVLSQAEHVLCNSQSTADDLVSFYGLPTKKITPILLAYDAHQFRPLGLQRQNYFLLLGRQAPYKNGAIALKAFAQMPNHKEFEFWIAGPPDARYTPILKQQASELGITPQVKFLDYVGYEELPILLNRAYALVFPSLWEGFGLPVLEAMACGTPVIASNVSSIPEVTGDAALLIAPQNLDNVVQAMHTLTRDPHLYQQLSRSGCDRAAQFTWQKTGEATVAVLRKYV